MNVASLTAAVKKRHFGIRALRFSISSAQVKIRLIQLSLMIQK